MLPALMRGTRFGAPLLAAAILTGFALFVSETHAGDPGKAQTYLMEGEAASSKGDHEAALEAFRKAHEAHASGATAVRIALRHDDRDSFGGAA